MWECINRIARRSNSGQLCMCASMNILECGTVPDLIWKSIRRPKWTAYERLLLKIL